MERNVYQGISEPLQPPKDTLENSAFEEGVIMVGFLKRCVELAEVLLSWAHMKEAYKALVLSAVITV